MRRAGRIAVLALCLLPAAARADAPQAGARYDGVGAKGARTTFVVSADGSKFDGYRLRFRGGTCNDHKPYGLTWTDKGERPTTIAVDGSFKFDSPTRGYGPKKAKALLQVGFQGQFTNGGQAVSGELHFFDRYGKVRCHGEHIKFAGALDGTPGAPLTTPTMASGDYAVADSARISKVRFSVFVPSQEAALSFDIKGPKCRHGTKIPDGSEAVKEVPLQHATLTVDDVLYGRTKDRKVFGVRVYLHGNFSNSGTYVFDGTLDLLIDVYGKLRKGHKNAPVIDSCNVRGLAFHGVFAPPAG